MVKIRNGQFCWRLSVELNLFSYTHLTKFIKFNSDGPVSHVEYYDLYAVDDGWDKRVNGGQNAEVLGPV